MIVIRLEWNKKYTTIAVYALIVIVLAILFVVFIFKYDSFANGFSWLSEVVAPIVIGICIAYVINPLVMWFENRVFNKLKDDEINIPSIWDKINIGTKDEQKAHQMQQLKAVKRRRRRRTVAKALSVSLSMLIVITFIVAVCVAIVPYVAQSIVDLADQMPKYASNLENMLKKLFENTPSLALVISEEFTELSNILDKIAEQIAPMASDIIGSVSMGVIGVITSVLVTLKNVLIGIMIAIYLLFSKERLLAQAKKIMFAFMKNNKCQSILTVCRKSNNIFKTFIVSNLLDALIIFIFMLIGTSLMDMPYAMLVSLVCGVTNLIPFFGPFIGAIPCGLLIILVDPIKVIWFGLFVLVLQQCDGNIIKPFLFGETMGLPALWVLISIIVSGGLFGIPGMLLGAPVFAVIYLLFGDYISARLARKNLPTATDDYYNTEEYDNKYAVPTDKEEASP